MRPCCPVQAREPRLARLQADALAELPVLQPVPRPSPGRRSQSADVETINRPRHPGLDRQLTVALPPGSSPGGTPRLVSLCHICRERVGAEHLQEHSVICVRLEELCAQVGAACCWCAGGRQAVGCGFLLRFLCVNCPAAPAQRARSVSTPSQANVFVCSRFWQASVASPAALAAALPHPCPHPHPHHYHPAPLLGRTGTWMPR